MRGVALIILSLGFLSGVLAQPPAGGGGMPANEVIFENNDGNGDGEITRAEADAAGLALSQNWDMFDLNSDDKVVAEELDQVRGQFGGGRGGAPGGGQAEPEEAGDEVEGDGE